MKRGDIYSIQNRFYVFLGEDPICEDISRLLELSDGRRLVSKVIVDRREKKRATYFRPIDSVNIAILTDAHLSMLNVNDLLAKIPDIGLYYESHVTHPKTF